MFFLVLLQAAAEADTFFCFVELLSGFRDNFCQQLDNSVVGIRSTITKLSLLLKEHDEELWRHLEVTCKINPQFYAFRWITLLLTQEFSFTDSLHIWDTLLSDPEGPQTVAQQIVGKVAWPIISGHEDVSKKTNHTREQRSKRSHEMFTAKKIASCKQSQGGQDAEEIGGGETVAKRVYLKQSEV
ncbi:hypothetical protein Cgig2_001306 [Carnegiea gigantea]|uniref:Rab-GAP TBC domain-containing protein n=1 Tax=Carnegiea gigantea TaxID=171969 RepID=A0A9Q1KV67_9CARY|nr:hypothetical protein Cgig2_001306 [Carnegiea gigantea]